MSHSTFLNSMRKVLVHCLSLLVTVLVLSCSHKDNVSRIDNVITFNVPIYYNDSVQFPSTSRMFDSITVVLETGGVETLLGGMIKDIKILDDTLIILSGDYSTKSTLQLFDINGRFIRKIDRSGRGPGEYININKIDIDPIKRHIIVFDSGSGILRYTMNGDFVSKVRYEYGAADFALLPDGGYVLFTPFAKTPHGGLWTIDSQGNFNRTLISYDEYNINVIAGDRWLTHINDSVIGFSGLMDKIYHIANDTIYQAYQVISEMIDPNVEQEENKRPPYVKERYYESDNLMMFELTNMESPYHYVRTFYEKKDGQTDFFFWHNHPTIPKDNQLPQFRANYKDCFFNELSPITIMNNDELKAKYPGITEESNPVLQIFRSK